MRKLFNMHAKFLSLFNITLLMSVSKFMAFCNYFLGFLFFAISRFKYSAREISEQINVNKFAQIGQCYQLILKNN